MKKKVMLALIILTALLLLAVPVLAQEGPSTGVVTGRVVNRSSDGSVPEKMELMLHAWDENLDEVLMLDGFSKTDGTFEYGNVSLEPDLLYAVMLTYDNVVYASEPVNVTEGQTELSLEIPIYESSTDTSSVRIDRQHVLFDAALDGLTVAEIYIISNTGDRTIAGKDTEDDTQLPPLQFSLPAGATDISFNEGVSGRRFILTPVGFVDSEPLRPGESTGQVIVSYVVPYEDGLTYSLTTQWPVDGLSFMLNPAIGLSLEGENLTREGTRDMGDGREVEIFSHDALGQGESVAISLAGTLLQPLVAPAGDMMPEAETDAGSASRKGLALGGAALGLALMAVGVWWYRRPEPEPEVVEKVEDESGTRFDHLVTQIAILDKARDRGDINKTEYDIQREQMVRQAKALLAPSPAQDAASPSPSY
ncbi:MAG: hypothetical protein WA996_25305 [Candidatus Promineifilaceae bacterium]